jgi:riboflavin kinase/FMN adenylyltransferase
VVLCERGEIPFFEKVMNVQDSRGVAAVRVHKGVARPGRHGHAGRRGARHGGAGGVTNIQPETPNKIVPKRGVYAVWIRIDGQYHPGMMNIGIRPTFEGESETIEVHIFDFDSNIYGKEILLQFVARVRDEKPFSGIDELRAQLRDDKHAVEKILNNKQPDIAKQRN